MVVLPDTLRSVRRAANPVNPGLCVIKDHVLPPANEPRHITQHSTVPPKSCALYSSARTTQHRTSVAQLYGFLPSSRFMFQRKICRPFVIGGAPYHRLKASLDEN